MADDLSSVPPIPYKSAVINDSGFISEPWSKFFRQVFNRIGGNIALSNKQLEVLPNDLVNSLSVSVTQLQSQVTALANKQPDDFNQGTRL